MPQKKRIIGFTEPSIFTKDVAHTIEEFFDANPFKLCQNKEEDINFWVDQCDAVILSGGCDIHPRTYGYAVLNDFGFSRFDVYRDLREIHIIKRCFEKNIPVFGICRGHQMLGIFHGVRFVADISNSLICHNPNHQKISHAKEEPMHWVKLLNPAKKEFAVQDEIFSQISSHKDVRNEHIWVNSFHHQGLVFEKGQKIAIEILGLCPGPGKVQLIELMRGKQNAWLSCQWHPEYDWDTNAASKMVLGKFKDMINNPSKQPILRTFRRKKGT